MVTLTLVFNLHVLRSVDADETVWLLRAIGRQAGRRKAKGLASRRWNPRDRDACRIHMLSALPGVGPERAERLLERFGSVAGVVACDEASLVERPGVGPETARRIRVFLDERSAGRGEG